MTKNMTEETRIKTDSLKAWLLAARPKTLTGAAVPVMIGVALAYIDDRGIRFDGDYNKALAQIKDFKPYWSE